MVGYSQNHSVNLSDSLVAKSLVASMAVLPLSFVLQAIQAVKYEIMSYSIIIHKYWRH